MQPMKKKSEKKKRKKKRVELRRKKIVKYGRHERVKTDRSIKTFLESEEFLLQFN